MEPSGGAEPKEACRKMQMRPVESDRAESTSDIGIGKICKAFGMLRLDARSYSGAPMCDLVCDRMSWKGYVSNWKLR